MGLCVDCKYCVEKMEFYICHHPKNIKVLGVDGHEILKQRFCSMQRFHLFPYYFINGSCGRRGRWFEEKS